jgi:CMP-N,N'-diacetyllegionaminic acid synthase
MKIAALLTGKGSNTLRDKNILPVCGHPLMYYPAMAARRCPGIERFYASSDSPLILQTAADLGYQKIVRPGELCQPASRHIDAITHALDEMQRLDGYAPDVLVVLLANNISIKTEWIAESLARIAADPALSAVVPVYEDQDHHPYRAKRIAKDGTVRSFLDLGSQNISSNRQDLPDCYYVCHNFWTLNLARSVRNGVGDPPWAFMGPNVAPIVVEESVDVHLQRDLLLCQDWLQRHGIPTN